LSKISFTTRMIELRLQQAQRHTKSIPGFAPDWNAANNPMRTKQPAALLKRKSISHSLGKRDFLVVRRETPHFLLSVFFLLIACSAFAQSSNQPGTAKFDGQSWWNYVKVLADDNMEGRDTGSAGLKRAEAFIVDELKADGLQPAGSNGYYQPVKLITRRTIENDSSLALFHDGKSEPLSFEADAYFSNRFSQAPKVDAQLVFVGWGLDIPEKGYSDLQGTDLKGKVAVLLLGGSPSEIPGPLSAHYNDIKQRWAALKKAGAIGIIAILNPHSMDIPWDRIKTLRTQVGMAPADETLNDTAGIKLGVTFNPASADKLFAGSGHTFQEISDFAKARKPLPRFPLKVEIRARVKMDVQHLESSNIVAKLDGNDPKLKQDCIVVSAHIDHLGIGEPINGDRIYNGAMDNGSGSAMLLDFARSFKESRPMYKRSVILLWVTGEEKGLLGSRYFAEYPTVPASSIVANINTDMFLPIIPLQVVTVYGISESDLGEWAAKMVKQHGVEAQDDPKPQRNAFIRSDQYSFIRKGVPAVAMAVGCKLDTPQQKAIDEWLHNRYHAPSDDTQQPVSLETAGKFEGLVWDLLSFTANSEKTPEWKPESFFKRFVQH
jgi:Zn-dependent M28 family amino/carboxypeptidase